MRFLLVATVAAPYAKSRFCDMGEDPQASGLPDEVHCELKVRAAGTGMSLSNFLNAELARLVAHRPLGELVTELEPESSLRRGEAANAVRAGRRK